MVREGDAMSKKKRICPECDGRGLMPYVIQTAGPLPKVGSGEIIHTITERVESRPCRSCGGTGTMKARGTE